MEHSRILIIPVYLSLDNPHTPETVDHPSIYPVYVVGFVPSQPTIGPGIRLVEYAHTVVISSTRIAAVCAAFVW